MQHRHAASLFRKERFLGLTIVQIALSSDEPIPQAMLRRARVRQPINDAIVRGVGR